MRRLIMGSPAALAGVVVVMGVAVGGLTAPAAAQPQRTFVYMFDFDFSIEQPGPGSRIEDAVIDVGDIVTWVPLHEFHNTIAAAGQAEYWESEILGLDDTFEWVFTVPGVYHYYCLPHGFDNGDGTAGGMAGTITVLPAPGVAGGAIGMAALMAGPRRRR